MGLGFRGFKVYGRGLGLRVSGWGVISNRGGRQRRRGGPLELL